MTKRDCGNNPTQHLFSAGLLIVGLGILMPTDSSAIEITTMKICDAATEDCAGNPETDTYKVTLDRSSGTDTGFEIDWGLDVLDTNLDPLVALRASSEWTVDVFSDSSIQLTIKISNDTILDDPATSNAALLSFGFGVNPDVAVRFTTNGEGDVFDAIGPGSGSQQTFPGGFKQIDVCIFPEGCSGGSVNAGLQASNDVGSSMDTLSVLLTPIANTFFEETVDLLFFPVKWQTAWGSFELGGSPPPPPNEPPGEPPPVVVVPTPGILALLGLGIFGMTVARRRRSVC